MVTLAPRRPPVLLAASGPQVSVPAWMRPYAPRTATLRQVRKLPQLAPVTVVQAAGPQAVLDDLALLCALADRQRTTARPSKIVFVFERAATAALADQLLQVLSHFGRARDVEFARGAAQGAFAVEEAFAKILADREDDAPAASPPGRDPLAAVRSVVAATADLRGDSGRLSAQRIAEAFGLAVAELAALAGKKRQTVSKTDDAESLQPALLPFERAARLRAVLSDGDFRRWLRMPSEALGGQAPLDAIRGGQVAVVADLAEDMLTGSPA